MFRAVYTPLILISFVAILGATGCDGPSHRDDATQTLMQGIVNGEKEDGYPGVGALTLVMGDEYTGSFCTGTLITPQWVLTAAHCVQGGFDRMRGREGAPDDTFFHFFVGTRADRRESGDLYQAASVHIHPGYTSRGGRTYYDIALMELAEPIAEVEPYPLFEGDLADHEGEEVFYTGFGMTDGVERTGGGVKHSKNLRIHRVYASTFSTVQNEGGVCFGDSGGPGLLQTEDGYRTVGVNSAAIGQVACMGWSSQMRADAYSSWIRSVMGEAGACAEDPELCQCPEACREDGVCDNSRCGDLRCGGIFECMDRCEDPACQYGCYASLTPIHHYFVERLYGCVEANCPMGGQFCVQSRCVRELYACFEGEDAATGDASCDAIHWCAERCDNDMCRNACYYTGSFDAQDLYRPVEDCVEANCPEGPLEMGRSACIARHCRRPLLACLPPDDCSLSGGSCEEGEACIPAAWGATYCVDAGALGPGAACELNAGSCEEGSLCLGGPQGAYCHALCSTDADCDVDGGPCERQAAPGAPFPLGVCTGICRDADQDGTCDDDDCAPENAAIHPDMEEMCGDDADNDCDGVVDEDCMVCVDSDGDGACLEEDCNDEDPSINDGAEEVCGDEIDNDCDEVVDEACPEITPDASVPGATDLGPDAEQTDSAGPIIVDSGAKGASEGAASGCDCSTQETDGGPLAIFFTLLMFGVPLRRRGVLLMAPRMLLLVAALATLLSGCVDSPTEEDINPDSGIVDAMGPDTAPPDAAPQDSVADAEPIDISTAEDAAGPVDLGEADMADVGTPDAADGALEVDMGPVEPTIERVQRGLIAPGTEITLENVITASAFDRGGVFVSNGLSNTHSGLWLEVGGELPDWPMGTVIGVTGTVVEHAWGEATDAGLPGTLDTRTQLEVVDQQSLERRDELPLPEAVGVTLGELAIPDLAELFEGVLVSLAEVTVSRVSRDGEIILNGSLSVDSYFVPETQEWSVTGLQFDSVTGIVDYRDGHYRLMPRMDADMPRPPASLGDCYPIGETYALCTSGKRWPRARDTCSVNGARLVILETAEENTALGELVRIWHDGSFWIGLSDRGTEGEFVWHNGEPLEYSGWANGEPNDHGAGEDCTESNWNGPGAWNDAACRHERVYVCEYPDAAPPCPSDDICPDGLCVDGVCQRAVEEP